MLQLIAILLISWLCLWLIARKGLSVLGLMPTSTRMQYFLLLFLVSAGISASAFLLRIYLVQETYTLAQSSTSGSVLREVWYQCRTVLTEELLCRGALLYLLIQKLGQKWAIALSALLFAGLHGLNNNLWGNPIQLLLVLSFTGAMGVLLAYGYVRTGSLLIPFAIHLGWNMVQNYIFPDGGTGNHLLVLAAPPPEVTLSYGAFIAMFLAPKIALLLFNYWVVKQHRPASW